MMRLALVILPIISKFINADLFRYIEVQIEKLLKFDVPGDALRDVILNEMDQSWSSILIATPKWIFDLTVSGIAEKTRLKKESESV